MDSAEREQRDQNEAGEKVARVCRQGRQDQTQRLAEDWPELARALGKLMREHGRSRPMGW